MSTPSTDRVVSLSSADFAKGAPLAIEILSYALLVCFVLFVLIALAKNKAVQTCFAVAPVCLPTPLLAFSTFVWPVMGLCDMLCCGCFRRAWNRMMNNRTKKKDERDASSAERASFLTSSSAEDVMERGQRGGDNMFTFPYEHDGAGEAYDSDSDGKLR